MFNNTKHSRVYEPLLGIWLKTATSILIFWIWPNNEQRNVNVCFMVTFGNIFRITKHKRGQRARRPGALIRFDHQIIESRFRFYVIIKQKYFFLLVLQLNLYRPYSYDWLAIDSDCQKKIKKSVLLVLQLN